MPTCPGCAETISSSDAICPFCGERLRSKAGNRKGAKSKTSTAAIVIVVAFGFVGLLFCSGIGLAIMLPAVQQAREAARRVQCKNNLKQIGLAMHNYHDVYRLFPAAHLNDDQGEPRLSWRVSILPYIDANWQYQQYNTEAPWDSPQNLAIQSPRPLTYACPSHPEPPNSVNTCYAAITGDNTLLGNGRCSRIQDVTDGTSNTLMVVEACGLAIPWTKPQDIDADTLQGMGDPKGVSSNHSGGAHILLADGTVRFISNQVDPKILKSLTRINDGEVPDND